MYDTSKDQKDRVSPPGYRVPKQKVWNALRNSPNFDTNSVGSYYNACYRSSVGNVYFPKVLVIKRIMPTMVSRVPDITGHRLHLPVQRNRR